MIAGLPRYILQFVFLVLLQVLVLNNIQLGGYINPYIYILFILLLPFDVSPALTLILGFITGFSIDLFTDTLGMHTSATVFMAYLRHPVLKFIAPRGGYEPGSLPRLSQQGLGWFLRYTLVMVAAHHVILFYAEAFRLSEFFATLLRIILSGFFSALLILMSQYLVYRE